MSRPVLSSPTKALVLGAMTLGSAVATAAPIPPPMQWTLGGVSSISFGNAGVALTNPPVPLVTIADTGGFASLSFSPTPTPSVTAVATGFDAADNTGAFAQGVFRYFGVIDAPGDAIVPTTINVVANGSLFSDPGVTNFGSDARVQLEVFGTLVVPLTASPEGTRNGVFSTTRVVSVNTNQVFNVEMLVRAWTFEPGVDAIAFLDPYFFLDQRQIDLGYTLRFSEGAGNSAVPVPPAWWLLGTGVAMLGGRLWRTRTSGQPVS
jgi:hypothetical protein